MQRRGGAGSEANVAVYLLPLTNGVAGDFPRSPGSVTLKLLPSGRAEEEAQPRRCLLSSQCAGGCWSWRCKSSGRGPRRVLARLDVSRLV